MRSIRAFLFVFFPFAAAVSLIASECHRSLTATIDWRDLSIQGRGYLKTVDDAGENPIFVRVAHLGVNQFGWLSVNIDGTLRPIDRHIPIPSDWTRIEIDQEGHITVGSPGMTGTNVGQIGITLFPGDDVNKSVQLRDTSDRMGEPMECEPGKNGAGYLMQRHAYQYCIAVTNRTAIAVACATFAIVICSWYAFQNNNKP